LWNFEVGKEITNNRCPSFILFITPSPSSTHSSKIDLSYPEVLLPASQNFTLPPKDGKKISVSSGPGNLKQPAQPQIHGHQCMRAKGAPTHLHVLPPPKKFQIVTKFTLQNHQKSTIFALKKKSTKGFCNLLVLVKILKLLKVTQNTN
jgi:hypothetical protein